GVRRGLNGAYKSTIARYEHQFEDVFRYRTQGGLRFYTQDGDYMGEYKTRRINPQPIDSFPGIVIDAVITAEDQNFWKHDGIDVKALVRAALQWIQSGRIVSGGSTI